MVRPIRASLTAMLAIAALIAVLSLSSTNSHVTTGLDWSNLASGRGRQLSGASWLLNIAGGNIGAFIPVDGDSIGGKAETYTACEPPHVLAERAAVAWNKRAHGLRSQRFPARPVEQSPDTAEALASVKAASVNDFCFCKFIFDGVSVTAADDFTRHCQRPALHMLLRRELYGKLFQYVIDESTARSMAWQPFEVQVDLTDGSHALASVMRALRLPVLTQSRGIRDYISLPLPDTHMVAALLAGTKRWGHILPKVLVKFGQGRQGSFIPSNSAWASKRAAAVYRGSCLPTIDSDSHSGRVFTRSDLCKLYGGRNSSLYDIGTLFSVGPCRAPPPPGGKPVPYCVACEPCASAPRLTVDEMRRFKYQISIDGHGNSFDGTVWKLLSNSLVFFVLPESALHTYEVWYQALLRPYVHYIPTEVHKLHAHLTWCLNNDAACEAIASAALETMRCIMRPETMLEYTLRVLRRAHDVQQPGAAAAGAAQAGAGDSQLARQTVQVPADGATAERMEVFQQNVGGAAPAAAS